MRVLLTGGTGYIGSAVLDSLVRAGHHVDALVRNREKAAAVQVRGAHPVIGDLSQPATYAAVAAQANGSVHTAMDDSSLGHALDALALDTLLAPAPAPRPGRFFIYTSGVWVLGPAPAPVDEGSPINPDRALGMARAARTARARGGRSGPAHGRRASRHRLRRIPGHRRRHVQVGGQWPGPRDWHR